MKGGKGGEETEGEKREKTGRGFISALLFLPTSSPNWTLLQYITVPPTITRFGERAFSVEARMFRTPYHLTLDTLHTLLFLNFILRRIILTSVLIRRNLSLTLLHFNYVVCHRWLGSRVAKALDLQPAGCEFNSQPRRCRVTTLGKLFTPMCLCHQAV